MAIHRITLTAPHQEGTFPDLDITRGLRVTLTNVGMDAQLALCTTLGLLLKHTDLETDVRLRIVVTWMMALASGSASMDIEIIETIDFTDKE